jgi:hypothetical protein
MSWYHGGKGASPRAHVWLRGTEMTGIFGIVDQLCAEELVEGVQDGQRRLTVQILGQR